VIEEVMSILHRNRIDVINKKKVWLTKEGATELFKHKSDNEFFTNLVDFMTR
jgi:nucleoside diphosphate kinase